MDISKTNELLKTIEKRGPFFVFDEINKNEKAQKYFFELRDLDSNVAKRCVAFHNAKNDDEKDFAWRMLLATFDEFRKALYDLKFELEDDAASALIGEIWGDCLDLHSEVKNQTPNKTRCLALRNQSNLSYILLRCCQGAVLKSYHVSLDQARQDVLIDEQ